VLSVPVEVIEVSGGLESSTGCEATRTLPFCSHPANKPKRAMRVRIDVVRMKSPFAPARVPPSGRVAERAILKRSDRFRAIFTPSRALQNAPRHNKERRMNAKRINQSNQNASAMMEQLESRELYSVSTLPAVQCPSDPSKVLIGLNQPAQPQIIAILIGL
jgi:hypothetical protein